MPVEHHHAFRGSDRVDEARCTGCGQPLEDLIDEEHEEDLVLLNMKSITKVLMSQHREKLPDGLMENIERLHGFVSERHQIRRERAAGRQGKEKMPEYERRRQNVGARPPTPGRFTPYPDQGGS